MSLLPQRILPQTEPWGKAKPDGTVTVDKNWWLFLYNISLQVLGSGSGLPADALIDLEGADTDATDSDAIALRQPVSNNSVQLADLFVAPVDFPSKSDMYKALLLAQEPLLQDPSPMAQPVAAISPTGSPFTYTAPFNGQVAITAGTVSAIALVRQGISTAAGFTSGLVMVSRSDQVVVTYSGVPTMTFLPT
jgi:hypothetical protein